MHEGFVGLAEHVEAYEVVFSVWGYAGEEGVVFDDSALHGSFVGVCVGGHGCLEAIVEGWHDAPELYEALLYVGLVVGGEVAEELF